MRVCAFEGPRRGAGARASARWARALGALPLAACAQVLGVSDYENVGEPDTGIGDPDPAWLAAPACRACLAQECALEDAACTSDLACKALVEQGRALEEPKIASRAWCLARDQLLWEAEQGQASAEPYQRFRDCARTACSEPCDSGQDRSCVGRFDYALSYPAHSQQRLKVIDFDLGEPLEGVSVRACYASNQCERPLGVGTTAASGIVTLDLDLKRVPHTVALGEFDGALLLEAGPDYVPLMIGSSRPMFSGEYSEISIQTWQSARKPLVVGLPTVDERTALLDVQGYDCNEMWMGGAVLEPWIVEPTGTRFCAYPVCTVVYLNSRLEVDLSQRELASGVGNAVVFMPRAEVILVLRDTISGQPISLLGPMPVQEGRVHNLLMYPLTREGLLRLPAPLQTPPPR